MKRISFCFHFIFMEIAYESFLDFGLCGVQAFDR